MNIVAIIPAKGMSKRMPGKNMKLFCGKPLVEWSLIQCKYSKYIAKTYLVTDSQEIADLGKQYDARIVWQTQEQIDTAEVAGQMGGPYSLWLGLEAAMKEETVNGVFTMLPTNPLRRVDDLDRCVDIMRVDDRYPIISMVRKKDIALFQTDGTIATWELLDKSGKYLITNSAEQFWLVHQFRRYYFKSEGVFNTPVEWLENKEGIATLKPVFDELWQEYDIDFQEEFEVCEFWMDRKILEGRGDEVYKEYHSHAMSEYGYKQNAAGYNKGVEANLLPFEYRNSFFNHFSLFLQSQKDEKLAGYELIEHGKDGSKKSARFWRANSCSDALSIKLETPKPALIIGSGPSLDDAGKYLKDWKGACFCSTSHATTLVKYGLVPSHIVAYDINSNPGEIDKIDIPWEQRSTKLISHPGCNPKLLDYWKGEKLMFRSMDTSNHFFMNILPIAYQDIIPSQMFLFSCSLAAQISLAKAMGYSPLFLVGCDFALARFSRWWFENGEWKFEQGTHSSVDHSTLVAANGRATDALLIFYKRSVLCVWRIDHSQCFNTSPGSVITEMPTANIEAVIAYQGEGFEKQGFTNEQIDDAAEVYLAHFNQFIIRFKGTGVKVVESGAEDKWEPELEGYMMALNQAGQQQGQGELVDISSNLTRMRWLKQQASLPAEPRLIDSSAG